MSPVLISAHASHAARAQSYPDAVAARADYVELDIRRTADDELVAFHEPSTPQGHPVASVGHARLSDLVGYDVPTVHQVLAVLKGRARGHLDLKEAGYEDRLVGLALDALGPGQFIVTTREDASVAAIRSRFPDEAAVPAALSLGLRRGDARPWARLRDCGARWVAADRRLALAGLARQCRRRDVKIMVWTVNSEPEIRYWLFRGHADVLITDRPALAVALRPRESRTGTPRPGAGG